MFSPDFFEKLEKKKQEQLKTSYGRFKYRLKQWEYAVPYKPIRFGKSVGYKKIHKIDLYWYRTIYLFWWFVHNCISHPIIGVCPMKWAFSFHDYTSDKINSKNPK